MSGTSWCRECREMVSIAGDCGFQNQAAGLQVLALIFIIFSVCPLKVLTRKGKVDPTITEWSQLTSAISEQILTSHASCYHALRDTHHFYAVSVQSTSHKSNVTHPNGWTFYKITGLYSLKLSTAWSIKKVGGFSQINRLKRQLNTLRDSIFSPFFFSFFFLILLSFCPSLSLSLSLSQYSFFPFSKYEIQNEDKNCKSFKNQFFPLFLLFFLISLCFCLSPPLSFSVSPSLFLYQYYLFSLSKYKEQNKDKHCKFLKIQMFFLLFLLILLCFSLSLSLPPLLSSFPPSPFSSFLSFCYKGHYWDHLSTRKI